ncbi:hypothetical protein EDB83DRAFT_2221412 [Lactarius deliciosus]|nr:hypothetical protein EDB83DRAFT_2221412 [Lactarius deliciosus]
MHEDLSYSTRAPVDHSDKWYPWHSRAATTLDIVANIPRSSFSTQQINTMFWFLKANGVSRVPCVRTLRSQNAALHNMCGIRTLEYDGVFGHKYFVNSLADIICQEMANPRVRPYLRFYPEDAGKTVNEYWHAAHWHEVADSSLVTPMAVINNTHFFVYEPAVLTNGCVVMPYRWFLHGRSIAARAWPLRAVKRGNDAGWIVEKFKMVIVPQGEFLISFGSWGAGQLHRPLPSAKCIFGSVLEPNGSIFQWTLTDPKVGNRWRVLAGGARVYSFPIWLYCDDVSGNQLKRWNKHYSFLFSAAGLPHMLFQHEYNVHFLCTSNLAPPLEMLDGIVSQLEAAWDTGVWAWDCVHEDHVLVIPFVAALLGDNPMQSEFACHVGPGGKMICRVCQVKGLDVSTNDTQAQMAPASIHDVDGGRTTPDSIGTSDGDSSADGAYAPANRRKRKLESMQEMVERVTRFVHIGSPRTRDNTLQELHTIIADAGSVGKISKIRAHKTSTGIKDTFLETFLEQMHHSYKDISNKREKQVALDNFRTTLPANMNMLSPVWRIRGLDPHADTPVEILHTVLLRFVKYFWRDVVHHQLGSNTQGKEVLKTRLNSLDISGLQLGQQLSGRTLVQYAGSLTGRDFHIIAQVAPYVLYDLVPTACFDAWVSLSNLVPLIWQPSIADIDEYVARLEDAITEFLFRVICWTPRWFNKPKFHFILHLPSHIRRFGPAVLFATETFESYNAIIRSKSVHSNRRAPSRDIAIAFAHYSRVRHLLSGGPHLFRDNEKSRKYLEAFGSAHSTLGNTGTALFVGAGIWRQITSVAPRMLLNQHSPAPSYTGPSVCVNSPPRPYGHTIMARHFPTFPPSLSLSPSPSLAYFAATSMTLLNGDVCRLGDWVLFSLFVGSTRPPALGRVHEIVVSSDVTGTPRYPKPDAILLQQADVAGCVGPYRVPGITVGDNWAAVDIVHILCSANIQHQCHGHHCVASGSEVIYQERQATNQTRAVVVHTIPEDLLLNTSRMHDAARFNQYRFPIDVASLDFNSAIMNGARQEVDSRKRTNPSGSGLLGRGRGTSRGRGGSSSRTVSVLP